MTKTEIIEALTKNEADQKRVEDEWSRVFTQARRLLGDENAWELWRAISGVHVDDAEEDEEVQQ